MTYFSPHGPPKQRHLFSASAFAQVGPTLFGIPDPNTTKNVEYGSAVQLSSATGNILAIGAPHHGYNSSSADPAHVSSDCGGIFMYLFNGIAWKLFSFFSGNPGEKIGDHLSLSSSGSRIAIRRYINSGSVTINQVEVYDVAVNNTKTKLGSNLSCGANGNYVTLSSSGSRVAVSCYTANSGRGLIQIYEWNSVLANWISLGQISSTDLTSNAFFGWSISFDTTGNRVAISAPNFALGGISNFGLVRVYDYNGSTWGKVGTDILGPTAGEQLGFSMHLSGDGLSVVASSPSEQCCG